ncbi:MAG: molybdate ABC transporter permease subunit [Alphaproteobacteria bacterium]|nr:molybdate ABC transporter permease subunit [Alphaproteobacteria bacterium]
MNPVLLSLTVASLATLAATVPAVALGTWLARRRGGLRLAVQAVVLAPLVLPPVVTGWVLLQLFGAHGPLAALRLPFTTAAAVVAGAVVGLPLYVRAVQLAVEAVDPGLEQAAATLGASPWRVLRTVTLPLALPGVVTGALLAFARALGEFGATILVAGNLPGTTRTLPLALFTALQTPGGEAEAARWAAWSLVLSLGALALAEVLARAVARRVGTA